LSKETFTHIATHNRNILLPLRPTYSIYQAELSQLNTKIPAVAAKTHTHNILNTSLAGCAVPKRASD
jgi:hypothetical protein